MVWRTSPRQLCRILLGKKLLPVVGLHRSNRACKKRCSDALLRVSEKNTVAAGSSLVDRMANSTSASLKCTSSKTLSLSEDIAQKGGGDEARRGLVAGATGRNLYRITSLLRWSTFNSKMPLSRPGRTTTVWQMKSNPLLMISLRRIVSWLFSDHKEPPFTTYNAVLYNKKSPLETGWEKATCGFAYAIPSPSGGKARPNFPNSLTVTYLFTSCSLGRWA